MSLEFLSPVHEEVLGFIENLNSHALGKSVRLNTKEDPILSEDDLQDISVAIIGVNEVRNSYRGSLSLVDINELRKELYSLFPGNWHSKIVDLGDVVPGETIDDTYYILKESVSLLLSRKIITIIIGGSQDLTYPIYRGYDLLEQPVNLSCIDSRFDLVFNDDKLHSQSYLNYIIQDSPTNLYNYANIGYQSYYNTQEGIDLMDKLFFEFYRLGEVSHNLTLVEPVLRDSDIVSLDAGSIQNVYLGDFDGGAPNGFTSREICSISRYAGISDRVSSFGIFNLEPHIRCYALMAQVIWYFIEGYNYRFNEYPFMATEGHVKYIVPLEDNDLYFYKSTRSERWWMKIQGFYKNNNNLINETLIPCTVKDYEDACNQIMPERWWKFYKKSVN